MSRRTRLAVVATLGLVLGGIGATSVAKRRHAATDVRLARVERRDLVSLVSASGKIEAKSSVDISADITGRIVHIAVQEGDTVQKGQFLLQIDPAQYEAAVSRAQGIVASAQASVLQARANREQAERAWKRAQMLTELGKDLIAPEQVEQAETAFRVADATHQASAAQLEQSRAGLQEARDNLAKTRLVAPMAGRIVRLAVEEGEVAVPGTFSKETGLLLTIADLSVMLATVQVDETDVVRLSIDDSVAVTIDAFPDSAFSGRVTRISHGAKRVTGATGDNAVDFDVEVTLTNPPRDVRPDLSCTARIVTDTRRNALSIPIIALTVRERETEGVFVVRDGLARFRPVTVGIAGDEHFEILKGLDAGDTIVAGTYQAVRDLRDSSRVRQADTTRADTAATP